MTDTTRESVLDNLSTAVLLLDENLCITYLNSACEDLFATSTHQIKDKAANEVFLREESAKQALRMTLETGRSFTRREAEIKILGKNPVLTDYSVTLLSQPLQSRFLLIEFHPLDRLLKISREEAVLTHQQSNQTLIRSIAHEVKNPLGGIRGAAQLLARQLPNKAFTEYTDVIIAEVDRLQHLVDELLGPPTLPKREAVNIHEVLERVRQLTLVEAFDSVRFVFDYDLSLPSLIADKNQLIQAILNIVRNAYQALTESNFAQDPRITLRTRVKRQVFLGGKRYRLAIQVDIEDNGPGINPKLLESIFYPMVSSRPRGNGLGLSIAQTIINQHNGLIECESAPGLTRFSITFPLELGHDKK